MMMLITALLALPSRGLGSMYPGASLQAPPEQLECYTQYEASTAAEMERVADFYTAEAARAGVRLSEDTKSKFPDHRGLTFIGRSKFMFVVLDRRGSVTAIDVRFKTGGFCLGIKD